MRLKPLQSDQLQTLFLQSAWQPHHRGFIAQVVEDGSPHVGTGKGSEGNATLLAIELGGSQQPQQSHLHQVIEGFGAAPVVVQGDRPHQVAVLLDPGVAPLNGLAARAGSLGGGGGHGCG